MKYNPRITYYPTKKHSFFFILCFIILSTNIFAGATGKLTGYINDDQGNPLVGVNIYLEGTPIGTASDENGQYLIINIPAAPYTVVVSYVGYQTIKMTDVIINADRTTSLNFDMVVSAVEGDEVIVEAKRPVIV